MASHSYENKAHATADDLGVEEAKHTGHHHHHHGHHHGHHHQQHHHHEDAVTDPVVGLPVFPDVVPQPLHAVPSPDDDGLTCTMPPVQPGRERNGHPGGLGAVFATEFKWPNGNDPNNDAQFPFKLNIQFLEGNDVQKQKVQQIAVEWLRWAPALFFTWDDPKETEYQIRIKFDKTNGSWSAVGNTALNFSGPTMNFGWVLPDGAPTEKEFRVIRHEFGHAIGLEHELGNPNVGQIIHWNKPAVYAYYLRTSGWSKEVVDEQIFKIYGDPDNFDWTDMDTDSVMLYPIPDGLTTDGWSHPKLNWQLSAIDKDHMSKMYALKVKMVSISAFSMPDMTYLTIFMVGKDANSNPDPRESYTRAVYARTHIDGLVQPSTSNSYGWYSTSSPLHTVPLVQPIIGYHSVSGSSNNYVYYWSVDEENQVCTRYTDLVHHHSTVWTANYRNAPKATAVAVSGMKGQDMHVFAQGVDGNIYELVIYNGTWTPWTQLPDISNVTQMSVVFNNRHTNVPYKQTIDLFALDNKGIVRRSEFDYETRKWSVFQDVWTSPSTAVYACANPNGAQVFIMNPEDSDDAAVRMYLCNFGVWKDPAYLSKLPYGKFKQLAIPSVWLNLSTQIVGLDELGDTWIFTDVQNLANWNGTDSAWKPLSAPKDDAGRPIFPKGKWAKSISAQQSSEPVDLKLGYRFIAVGIDDYVYTLYTRPGLLWAWKKLF